MKASLISVLILVGEMLLFPMQISEPEIVTMDQIAEPVIIREQVVVEEPIVIEEPEEVEEAPSNRWGIELTEEEIDMLAKIVFLEAGNQCDEGMDAVSEIIFNRMIDEYFCGSLEEVISSKGQFSTYKHIDKAVPTEKTYESINRVLSGETNILSFEYVYFATTPHKKEYVKIGDHYFSKK